VQQYEIVQGQPSQLTPSLLLEKNPIVVAIPESSNVTDIIKTSLRYLYVYYNTQELQSSENFIKNTCRYAFISTKEENAIVYLSNPKEDSIKRPSISIKITPSYLLIVPMFWYMKVSSTCTIHRVYDVFSSVYQTVYSIL
jgi:hypothetical protein